MTHHLDEKWPNLGSKDALELFSLAIFNSFLDSFLSDRPRSVNESIRMVLYSLWITSDSLDEVPVLILQTEGSKIAKNGSILIIFRKATYAICDVQTMLEVERMTQNRPQTIQNHPKPLQVA